MTTGLLKRPSLRLGDLRWVFPHVVHVRSAVQDGERRWQAACQHCGAVGGWRPLISDAVTDLLATVESARREAP